MSSLQVLDIALLALLGYCVKQLLARSRRGPLPPGPRGLPLVGSAFSWPTSHEWLTFSRWGAQYGDLVYTTLFGRPVLLLNSARAAGALLDAKGALYSDRAQRTMLALSTMDQAVGTVRYGPRHRALRTLILKTLGTRATVGQFAGVMEERWGMCARGMVREPGRAVEHVKTATAAIILCITYGYDVHTDGTVPDPMVAAAVESVSLAASVIAPKAYLVDALPILRHLPTWLPGTGALRLARTIKEKVALRRALPHAWVRAQMAAGTAQSSFAVDHLSDSKASGETEDLVAWASSSLFAAGFDTSASSVHTFLLAMTLYPAVQRAAQAELDSVIGPGRLPVLADWDELPYVRALVKEVLRWGPVTPQGLPHRLMEDDFHDGYWIPKGTVVIPNIWQMLHDPEVYIDPHTFEPARFLGATPARDPAELAFGFGRRICPGRELAQASIFVACATLLALFDVRRAKDEYGREVEVKVEYSSGLLSHPEDFAFEIVPRSERAKELAVGVELSGA